MDKECSIEISYNYETLENSKNKKDPIFIEVYGDGHDSFTAITLEDAKFLVEQLNQMIEALEA